MNRIINTYGAVNHNSPVGAAVDTMTDIISVNIRSIVNEFNLTPEEIITLEHKAAGAVTASCAEHILRKGLAMRKAEREATVDIIATLEKVPELRPKLEKLKVTKHSAKRDLRTPAQWCEFFGVEVIDPDGWRNSEPSWNTPITRDMFKARYQASTVRTVDAKKFAPWKNWLDGV